MTKYIIIAIRTLMVVLWTPAAVFAGAIAYTGADASPLNIPPVLLVATMFFSSLAGATTLSIRFVAELKANADAGQPAKALLYPWATGLSHMLGSWLSGGFFFLVSMGQQAGVWTLLAVVLIASFGGAKALEKVADNYLLSRLPKVEP